MKTFENFASFALHLGMIAASNTVKTHEELKIVVETLEKRIKDRFGHYIREDRGKFREWPELSDYTKTDRVKKGFPENEPLLRTGALRDSISSDVKLLTGVIGSTSDIMVWQELGTKTIPARSVLGAETYKAKEEIYKFWALTTTYRIAGIKNKVNI